MGNSMSDTIRDDYFSYMSNRGGNKRDNQQVRGLAPATNPLLPSDIIDFEEEPQIEVTESFVSDTTIQRLFKRWGKG